MSSTTKWIALSALAAALIVAVLSWTKHKPDGDQSASAASKPSPGIITAKVPGSTEHAASAAQWPPVAVSGQIKQMGSPLDSVAPPQCRTTPDGDLVIDPTTRNDVELVAALYKPDEALGKLGDACKDASPKAQRTIKDLYQQYVQYTQAIKQTFPMEEQLAIPIDKLQAVLGQGLHDLRVQYFGAERACARFCEEEEMSKRMLAMAVEYKQKHPNANTEEAVGYAQEQISDEVAAKEAAREAALNGAAKNAPAKR